MPRAFPARTTATAAPGGAALRVGGRPGNCAPPRPAPASGSDIAPALQPASATAPGGRLPPPTPRDRLTLAAGAGCALLAPGAYLALVAGAAWFLIWRLLRVPALNEGIARGAIQEYIAWLAVAAAALALLIKPLVAPRGARPARIALPAGQALALQRFARHVASGIGARAPGRIILRCDATTRVRLPGPLGLIRGGWTLEVGAAMIAGLSVRQFGALLAQEMSRLVRPDVALAGAIIVGARNWLQRAALEPDRWDQQLSSWGRSSGSLAMLLGGVGGLAAAAPRRVLWGLMLGADRATAPAVRLLEAQAEAARITIAGSDRFDADTARFEQMRSLWKAALIAVAETERGRLPDNLPALAPFSERRRGGGRRDVAPRRALAPTATPVAGIVTWEAPAARLVAGFEDLCRELTRRHYLETLGEAAPAAELISTARLTAVKAAGERAEQACRRFFAGALPRAPVPAPATPPRAPEDEPAALKTLRSSRDAMIRGMAAWRAAEELLREADRLGAQVARIEALVAAEFRFAPADFDLEEVTAEAIGARRLKAQQAERSAVLAVTPHTRVATRRLRSALELLHAAGADRPIPDVEARRRRVARLWPCWRAVTKAMNAADKLRMEVAIAEALLERLPSQWEKLETARAADGAVAAVARRLGAVAKALGDAEDPFEIGAPLRETVAEAVDEETEAEDVLAAAKRVIERLDRAYSRSIAELAEHAEAVERALGLGAEKARKAPQPLLRAAG